MAIPHIPLISHTVKKGENLTKIVKKYGHPGGEWKPIYNGYYNKPFAAACPDPNKIKPGEIFKVPSITRKRLDQIISLLWTLEDWTTYTLSAHKSVWAELKKLKAERTKTGKTFRKSRRKLLAAYEEKSDTKMLVNACIQTEKELTGTSGLGVMANCMVKYAGVGPSKNEMKELGKLYEDAAIDADKVKRKIADMEKALERRRKIVDQIVSAQENGSKYFMRNYQFLFK